ncbi:MAG: hypothetical protein ACYSU7_16395 [Planctomycetota bacterium]|jgi:hypothetical protein
MKVKTLSLLAGVSGPLILTGSSGAGFVGLKTVNKPNAFGIWVHNVYAEFDNPGNDWVQAVAGTPGTPLKITVLGGTFYNHQFGSDKAPGTALIGAFPSLAFDSFFTIGKKYVSSGDTDFTHLVNMPTLEGHKISTTNGSWAIVPPTAAQGNPFDPVNSFPGNGQVLIGQFSTTDGAFIIGSALLNFVSDGVVTISPVSFGWPAPPTLSLLAIAGLTGSRRRRN